jgi:uncharacterized membrane protein
MQQPTISNVRWEWIGEGWKAFADKWGMWVVHSLVSFLVFIATFIPFGIGLGLIGAFSASSQSEPPPAVIFLFMLVFYPLMLLVTSYLMAGFYKTAFKQLRGEATTLGDLFSGGDSFLRVASVLVILTILSLIGFFLCIIPGFIVQGLLYFAIPLTIEKKLSPMAAIQASMEATKKDWIMYTCFAFVVQILASLGVILCYVGLLATYPWHFITTAVAYRQVFGLDGYSPTSYSPPPPPNYGEYNPPPPPPSSWQ